MSNTYWDEEESRGGVLTDWCSAVSAKQNSISGARSSRNVEVINRSLPQDTSSLVLSFSLPAAQLCFLPWEQCDTYCSNDWGHFCQRVVHLIFVFPPTPRLVCWISSQSSGKCQTWCWVNSESTQPKQKASQHYQHKPNSSSGIAIRNSTAVDIDYSVFKTRKKNKRLWLYIYMRSSAV